MTTTVPLRSKFRLRDAQNPTLIPNMDVPVASGAGTLDVLDPASFAATYPIVDATVTATIGGTVTTGDTVTLTFTAPGPIFGQGIPNATLSSTLAIAYTTVAGDTTTTVAEGLLDAVNSNQYAQSVGLFAEMGGEVGGAAELVPHFSGPVGNTIVLTASVSGSATETVTIANSGKLSGGSGPVVPVANFTFGWNGVLSNFWYGVPRVVGTDQIAAMVAQGCPIS